MKEEFEEQLKVQQEALHERYKELAEKDRIIAALSEQLKGNKVVVEKVVTVVDEEKVLKAEAKLEETERMLKESKDNHNKILIDCKNLKEENKRLNE